SPKKSQHHGFFSHRPVLAQPLFRRDRMKISRTEIESHICSKSGSAGTFRSVSLMSLSRWHALGKSQRLSSLVRFRTEVQHIRSNIVVRRVRNSSWRTSALG